MGRRNAPESWMMTRSNLFTATALILTVGFFSAGCADDKATPEDNNAGQGDGSYWLDQDPGAGQGVRDSRGNAPIEEAIVTGRVSDLVKGVQAFKITDQSLTYCGQDAPEDGCKTPWDYCCLAADEVRANTILVELQDDQGAPLSGTVADLKPLDILSVRGQLKKDDHGNVTLVADALFRKERPAVGDHIHWPQ